MSPNPDSSSNLISERDVESLRSFARLIAYACSLAGTDAYVKRLAKPGTDIWSLIDDVRIVLFSHGVDLSDYFDNASVRRAIKLLEDPGLRAETALYANYLLNNVYLRRRKRHHHFEF